MTANQVKKKRTVGEIMSSPVVTATSSETVADVASRMVDEKVGSVVVVDGERPVGILTERDLIRVASSGAEPSATKVSEWMTEDPDTVSPDTPIEDAFASLSEKGYRHIPVVDDASLKGIVSLRDLMTIARIQPTLVPLGSASPYQAPLPSPSRGGRQEPHSQSISLPSMGRVPKLGTVRSLAQVGWGEAPGVERRK